jgi:phage terminase Nu1 subunit (DNA packaging protein)
MERLINEKVVAEITGLALQTLRNARYERKGIPYIRLGGAIRYDLQDVMTYIKTHRIDPEKLADRNSVEEK